MFSGIFIVVAGSLADRLGRVKLTYIGLALSILGSLLIALSPAGAVVFLITGRIIQGLSAACIMPATLSNFLLIGVSLLAGLVIFLWFPRSSQRDRLRNLVLVFDGAGLALFAVAGAQKALGYGLNPAMAALLGMLSGIGGGMLRDLLVAEIPDVLRSELYAVAALAGAAVVVVRHLLNVPPAVAASAGAAFCFGIRLIAIWRGWRLPVARLPEQSSGGAGAPVDSTDDRAKKF